jgi:hypothetical protein
MLDAVLLLAGVFHFLDVTLAEGTMLTLQAMLLLFCYWGITLFSSVPPKTLHWLKIVTLLLIIGVTVGSALTNQMQRRRNAEPHQFVHDHPLQMEASVQFLLEGNNPYTSDFRGTVLEQWAPHNPALDHVIALPFTFLKSIPVYAIWHGLLGWYDDRLSHIPFLALAIASLILLFRRRDLQLIGVIAFVFNPLFTPFFIEGRSDIIFLSLVIACLACLRRSYTQAALVFLALAVVTKHTAWFIVPFVLTYLVSQRWLTRNTLHRLVPFLAIVALFIVPFLLWDARAFIEDIYHYPAGTLPASYFIKGYGLSKILANAGGYAVPTAAQLLLLPWLIFLMFWTRRQPTLSRVVLSYGLFLWPFWFLARFFNNNYLGVLVAVFLIALLLMYDEQKSITHKK